MIASRSWYAMALLFVCAPFGRAADEPLTKVQVGKIGKASTALVESRDGGRQISGSAFCIHPSGLFVTNEHIAQGDLRIVLNPGLAGEKVHKAVLVRSDKVMDLALLRVEGVNDLPHLALGSDEKLTELTELVAIGFPFGNDLTQDRKGYPEVSVNVGSITSLRRKNDTLHRIQLDAVLNPGNSGGPVLDMSGKVVGVVVSGVKGSGVNFAIPVSTLASFVARPDVQFTPPQLGAANVNKAVSFKARVVPLIKPTGPVSVELMLKTSTGKERVFPMVATGDTYAASVVPLPPAPTSRMRLVARFENGTINATTADLAFKVGEREVKLSEVKSVTLQPGARVVLHDGKLVEGAVLGLHAVPVQFGEQSLAIDLGKATEVKFAPDAEADHAWCTLTVRQGDTVVLRRTEMLAFEGLLAAPAAPSTGSGIKPPLMEDNKIDVKLPSPVTDVAVGGGGRYLVLHMPKARKLAIFDVNAGQIVGGIPVEEDGAKFAAGLQTVVVVLPHAGTIERWNLQTREREVFVDWPIKGELKAVTMGSASKGPLLVHSAPGLQPAERNEIALFNVETMKLQLAEVKLPPHMFFASQSVWRVRASSDGKVFGMWSAMTNNFGTIVISDASVTAYAANYMAGYAIPSPDGKTIYTMHGQSKPQFERSGGIQPGLTALPACHGDSQLRIVHNNRDPVLIHTPGNTVPTTIMKGLDLAIPDETQLKSDFTFDKRVHLIPDARVLVTISAVGDRLTLHRLP